MKRTITRFLFYFLGIFLFIMIFGGIFKLSNIGYDGIVRAIVISSASALSWVIGQYIVEKKMSKKKE